MSLINQMLKDLDARHASSEERGGLPPGVRPLPDLPPPSSGGMSGALWGALGGALVLLVGVGLWAFWAGPFSSHLAAPAGKVPAVAPAAPPVAANVPAPAPAAVSTAMLEAEPILKWDDTLSPQPATPSRPAEDQPAKAAAAASTPQKRNEGDKPLPGGKSEPLPTPVGKSSPLPLPPEKPQAVAQGDGAARGKIEKSLPGGSAQEHSDQEYRRAAGLVSQGRGSEAANVLRGVLRDNPGHGPSRQLLLKLLVDQRAFGEAIALLEEGLKQNPERLSWGLALARLQMEKGDGDAAWRTLQRLSAQGAASVEYHALTAAVLQRLGRHHEAADQYRAALSIAPNEGRWWLGLAMALEAEGNGAEAKKAFGTAKAMGLPGELANYAEQHSR